MFIVVRTNGNILHSYLQHNFLNLTLFSLQSCSNVFFHLTDIHFIAFSFHNINKKIGLYSIFINFIANIGLCSFIYAVFSHPAYSNTNLYLSAKCTKHVDMHFFLLLPNLIFLNAEKSSKISSHLRLALLSHSCYSFIIQELLVLFLSTTFIGLTRHLSGASPSFSIKNIHPNTTIHF